MNVVSLFSGIGGFDLGFERAGFQVAACVEIDQACRTVLARHFPNAQQYEDVRHVTGSEFANADVLVGGFPCQDVSIAGRRAGLAGERSGLWHEFRRIAAEAKTEWVVIENVPGLLSSRGGRDFAVILRGLVECGYGVAWRILDSQYFGVPQRRRRLFIVGHLGDGRAASVLFERSGAAGNNQTCAETQQTASADAGGGSVCTDRNARVYDARGYGGGCITPSLTVQNGRITDYTIIVHTEDGLRRLTPLECERLQGFPDGWTAGHSDTARYKMLGNAVTVPVAQWIAQRIEEAADG
jgi:DNA (cytosine-5)-methyltransferase 1